MFRTRPGCSPDCLTKPRIFSAMTGNTHGMTFRINPPRNAKTSITASDPAGAAAPLFGCRRRAFDRQIDFHSHRAGRIRFAPARMPAIRSGQMSLFVLTILRKADGARIGLQRLGHSVHVEIGAGVGIEIRRGEPLVLHSMTRGRPLAPDAAAFPIGRDAFPPRRKPELSCAIARSGKRPPTAWLPPDDGERRRKRRRRHGRRYPASTPSNARMP
jgi:hypothetical protein